MTALRCDCVRCKRAQKDWLAQLKVYQSNNKSSFAEEEIPGGLLILETLVYVYGSDARNFLLL